MKLPRRVHRGVCMPLTWLAGLCGCTAADSKGRTAFMRHILGITDEERQQRRWVWAGGRGAGAGAAEQLWYCLLPSMFWAPAEGAYCTSAAAGTRFWAPL
jgi:hypothetical protein